MNESSVQWASAIRQATRKDDSSLEAGIEALPAAIYMTDAEGRMTYFNEAAARLWGRRPVLMQDMWCGSVKLFWPDGTPLAPENCPMATTLRRQTNASPCEVIAERADGTRLPVLAHPTLLRDESGVVTGAINMLVDISEQKQVHAKLLKAQKMESVGRLAGGVAHDFNNLLTVILGHADLLVEKLQDQPEAKGMADAIMAAANRGAELTQRLLTFGRRQMLSPCMVNGNELIRTLNALIERVLREDIIVALDLDEAVPDIMVDPGQLESAILNLALNAQDAMPKGGTLTISTRLYDHELVETGKGALTCLAEGRYAMITVADTGHGMAPEVLSRAFEPFFTTKPPSQGGGMGLSMVFGFACQSGGLVAIDSALGEGTRVRLYLPALGVTA
ncbi:MAG: PAS domain S-box protein [Alphaproteobacteria bacterium]|nr:PAS domain S-box protein [Alphaproteobacteria bacterium]